MLGRACSSHTQGLHTFFNLLLFIITNISNIVNWLDEALDFLQVAFVGSQLHFEADGTALQKSAGQLEELQVHRTDLSNDVTEAR